MMTVQNKYTVLKIEEPHFHTFDGCVRQGHHSVLTIKGYNNILIGTLGASRTVYKINKNKQCELLSNGNPKPLNDKRFIWCGNSIIHINTKIKHNVRYDYKNVNYVGKNIFNISNKEDTVIKWTGTRFKEITKHNPDEDNDTDSEEWAGETLERPKNDLRDVAGYDMLIDTILNSHPYVNNREDDADYLNGDFESPVPSNDMRNHMRKNLEKDEFNRIKEIKEKSYEKTKW
jgi:hypothetical protein